MSLLISFVAFLLFGLLLFWFLPRYSAQIDEDDRCSPDSKDFKIGDPVAIMHGGRLSFWYIASIALSLRPDKFSNLYVLERSPFRSADYHFQDEEIRHPTTEELEKYFRK